MITQKINVPLASSPPFERIKMHYGDSGRIVEVSMLFDNQPFTPPSGASATFQAKKPDGTVISRTDGVSMSGSTVTVEITSNTLAQVGIVYCECLIFADGETVGTMRFEIEVMPPAVLPGDIESTDDYQAVADAAASAQAAQAAAETAQAGAEASEQSAGIYADIAQNAELHPVIVGENGNLWNWDGTSGAYVDSGHAPPQGPQGVQGIPGEDGKSFNIFAGRYREPGSIKDLPDLPAFTDTAVNDAYVVDDDAVDGQLDLYYHGVDGTDWTVIQEWGGVQGEQGDPGLIQSIVPGNNVTVDNTDPANPIISASGGIDGIVQGTGISIDNADPKNPVISKTVTSINTTLSAGLWSGNGPYTYTIGNPAITSSALSGYIGIATSATAQQVAAGAAAKIRISAQANGSFTLTADGIKPTVNIPIIIQLGV